MSNRHDEIKNLIKASRDMLSSRNSLYETNEIKKQYGILNEQQMQSMNLGASSPIDKIDIGQSIEDNIDKDEEYETVKIGKTSKIRPAKEDISQGYQISNGALYIYGKDKKDVMLTTDEKIAFQESMEEFVNEVSDLVDFNALNIYKNNVVWSGKLIDFNLDFELSVGEDSGTYIEGKMIKLDKEFRELSNKLETYYEKFKSKWSKILGMRKKTKLE
jgi:hypothetical protein